MPSTPLTSCSIGVATDCSTATAEAPGYVAVTRMVGGARKGYCSKLRLRRVLSPSRTMMIEMTMATMGRRMKKLAMALALHHRGGGRLGGGRTGRHLDPGADLLHAFHHDPVAGLQPFVDD